MADMLWRSFLALVFCATLFLSSEFFFGVLHMGWITEGFLLCIAISCFSVYGVNEFRFELSELLRKFRDRKSR